MRDRFLGHHLARDTAARAATVACVLGFLAGFGWAGAAGAAGPVPSKSVSGVQPDAGRSPPQGIHEVVLENGVRVLLAEAPNPDADDAGAVWVMCQAGALDEEDHQVGAASMWSKVGPRIALSTDSGDGRTYEEALAAVGVREGTGFGSYASLDHSAVFVRTSTDDDGVRLGMAFLARSLAITRGWSEEGVEENNGDAWDARFGDAWREAGEQLVARASGQINDYQRTMSAVFGPGSRLGSRWPVPTRAQCDALTPTAAHEFSLRAWSPDRLVIVVVGARDEDAAVGAARDLFGRWRAEPEVSPSGGVLHAGIEPKRGAVAVPARGARADEVGVLRVKPVGSAPRLPREEALERLAAAVLAARVDAAIRRGVIRSAEAQARGWSRTGAARFAEVTASGAAGSWAELVRSLGMVVGSVGQEPVTRAEIDGAREVLLARIWAGERFGYRGLTGGLERASQIGLAVQMAGPVWVGSDGVRRAEAAIDALFDEADAPGAVWLHMRAMTDPEQATLVVRGPLDEIGDGELDARAVEARAVSAFHDGLAAGREIALRSEGRLAVADKFGTAVAAAETVTRDTETGVLIATLTNGVRVMHKQFEGSGSVKLRACLWGGEIEETGLTHGYTSAAGEALRAEAAWVSPSVAGAVGEGVWVAVEPASIVAGVEVRSDVPGAVEHGMVALRAVVDSGGPMVSDIDRWRGARAVERARVRGDAVQLAIETAVGLGRPNDRASARALDSEREALVSAHDARGWYQRLRDRAPMTVVVVGDIDAQAAVELAGRAFGGVVQRGAPDTRTFDVRRALRTVPWWNEPVEVRTTSADGVACVVVGGAGVDHTDVRTLRALALGADVLERRVQERVRAEIDPGARAAAIKKIDRVYRGHSRMMVVVRTSPEHTEAVRAMLDEELARLASEAPGDDAWTIVREEARAQAKRAHGAPGAWAGRLAATCWDEQGVLAEMASFVRDYHSLTADEVRDAWAGVVGRGVFRVVALPAEGSGE